MVLLNNYFHHDKLANEGTISVSGKLEAFIGNYFVSGEDCPGELQNRLTNLINTRNFVKHALKRIESKLYV